MKVDAYPIHLPGKRQKWHYNVQYFGGDKQSFQLDCISLPFPKMSRAEVIRRLTSHVLQVFLL